MDAKEARRLIHAEGYLDLDLPREAWRVLTGSEVKSSYEWLSLAAEVHRQIEEYQLAIGFIEQAIKLRPEEISLYINLGWCLKRTDRLSEAIDALLTADRICRQLETGEVHPLVMYNLSCYYALAGDKEETLSWLSASLDKDPNFARLIAKEPDFDRVRQDPDFQALVLAFSKRIESES